MKQLDLFPETLTWPTDSNGVPLAGICRAAPDGHNILVDPPKPTKIYESPDKGQTVYEREFGANPTTRRVVKTAVQQQWKIVYGSTEVKLEDALRIL